MATLIPRKFGSLRSWSSPSDGSEHVSSSGSVQSRLDLMDSGSLPWDLIWFRYAVEVATAIDERFDLEDLEHVEAACRMTEREKQLFGWVVVMVDGRRLYIEYSVDEASEPAEDLQVILVPEGKMYPALERLARVAWYLPTHINLHLGLAR